MRVHKPFNKKCWFYLLTTILIIISSLGQAEIGTTSQGANPLQARVVFGKKKRTASKTSYVRRRTRRNLGRSNPIANTVYIAPTSGKRYHFSPNCRGLTRAHGNIKKISLRQAKRQGYTLCGWEK